MAKMKYEEVRSVISNLLCDEDFAKVEEAFAPTPTPTPAVSITGLEATTVVISATVALSPTIVPADASVTYSSSDNEKATVTDEGIVTGVAAGDVVITVNASKEGYTSASATVGVTVTA